MVGNCFSLDKGKEGEGKGRERRGGIQGYVTTGHGKYLWWGKRMRGREGRGGRWEVRSDIKCA